jgi:hypothetical protein
VEQNELTEKVQKLGELIGALSVTVYTQSCCIQVLGQASVKSGGIDPDDLIQASNLQRQSLRAAMKNLGIVGTELDELDEIMTQLEESQKDLAKEQKAFEERRRIANQAGRSTKDPR